MQDLDNLLLLIENDRNCVLHKQKGEFELSALHRFPSDLQYFYERCDGIEFFPNSEYPLTIVNLKDFVKANPVIVGEECSYDQSFHWYIIGRSGNQYITIDLSEERLGQCYDSFWDSHGIPGSCPIIAKSFTDLLSNFYFNNGRYWFWLDSSFINLGDAYDG
jgi:antitoxin YokJ